MDAFFRRLQSNSKVTMKLLCLLLAIFALTVSAFPIEDEESDRENGENGWYVPQLDGTFVWMTIEEGEALVDAYEAIDEQGLITNTVKFYLYTELNPTKGQKLTEKTLAASNFNPALPTTFVIHGWTQSYTSGMNKEIRDAYLSKGNHNVIVVDWIRARNEYASAVGSVKKVGKKVAAMIDLLNGQYGLSLDTLTVAGHSLGAHVAGHTGKNVKSGQINTIVGMDAALPLFSYKKTHKRLHVTDAFYVEAIHTHGGGLGFLKPIAKTDFYPNGGKSQPGCWWDLTGACDHARSCSYFAETVEMNSFPSIKCQDYKEASKNNCGGTYSSVRMGSESNKYSANGEYFVPVNSNSPFGMG